MFIENGTNYFANLLVGVGREEVFMITSGFIKKYPQSSAFNAKNFLFGHFLGIT